jgi:ABC-2 type transport system ATP-binding protein
MYAIKTEKLTKKYKEKTAVSNLDLKINEGEMYGLLGVNGAGKTTTMKMLTTLIMPTSGEAELLGHSIKTDRAAVKQIIGISPQESAAAMNLTARENLELMAEVYGFSKKVAKAKASELIERFSMREFENRKAKRLSGGEVRRLSIAMALISEPKILFLDEPTLGLDVIARHSLWAEIEKLKGKITVILTTHYLEEAVALCDRIGIMAHGKFVAEGTSDELVALSGEKDFESAFVKLTNGGAL